MLVSAWSSAKLSRLSSGKIARNTPLALLETEIGHLHTHLLGQYDRKLIGRDLGFDTGVYQNHTYKHDLLANT